MLNFVRPFPNSLFDCHNPKGIKLITRLRLGLSHLIEHKLKHSFQDTINPLCNCGQDIEFSTLFFLHCLFFINESCNLLSTIHSLDSKLLDCTEYEKEERSTEGIVGRLRKEGFGTIWLEKRGCVR